ncbi:bifunctional adenosylcobinamide kinase/adenosylcobinamide-phosphate guanylyltransferase [Leptolyngbyaceae cyanobacterium CCMR0082]|uniref:Adenosylcobinamide kinase n=2 Tax=Adonisia turfae TaxID=2950184 RepID=A0A6M0S3B0_9CYAN|nr:bifunctional adenosylcobinamide kinase/adenosylcobinamide-phosphate guanylyltransferase [Adonisia turfae]MDV3349454.1 bifunctional adenosylcobinamide kinase/adenosylcobinamide-phosphate guanylyltransferase [Leptothoe sp. LEGE 181152]NEZ54925.1 bifunctional adenosylcobinamide kinase/adenosylcobinamide-phosphate guanylyltransferase [Adonisia turfae CCMR0081]NEZ62876.1 bifunctional adenosylcobinamide kinase/adenosylcobinamide-phosphate guanylyltransferase [Adonisia turfae CCMR0082]
MPQLILVTGPARSGKSEWAEHWAEQTHKHVIYVATSTVSVDDVEWQQRIEQHRVRRPESWQTLETPKNLANAIQTAEANSCLLVDSLGTWLANCLDEDDSCWQMSVNELLTALDLAVCDVILVAEETGWGIVPAYPLGRIFRDRLGYLVRRIGAIATEFYLVTGGYALDLKRIGTPLPHKH